MAEKKSRTFYNNKNGNMEVIEFLALISDEEEYDKFLRSFTTTTKKCPPIQLLELNTRCFFCCDCWNGCKNKLKKTKTGFTYGSKKYTNDDIDKWIEENKGGIRC